MEEDKEKGGESTWEGKERKKVKKKSPKALYFTSQ